MHKVTAKDFSKTFRWLYAAVVEEAKRCLAKRNKMVEGTNLWPAGQEWEDLGNTSKSVFLIEARENLGIPHKEFLFYVREGLADVEDVYEQGASALKG